MHEQKNEVETPIENPLHWTDAKLHSEISFLASSIAKLPDGGRHWSADPVPLWIAKLTLYSNELARRAANRESRSTRFLAWSAIVVSVVLGIAQIVVGVLALPK